MKPALRILKHQLRRWTRSFIMLAVCCALTGGTIGFPSVRIVAKDHSQPFPCQDRPCGCMNAESCWRQCCCHTNKQKLAWAKKNGVTPPAYVFAAAAAEDAAPAPRSCCAKREHQVAEASHCEKHDESPATAAKETQTKFTLILSESFRKCQGQSHQWSVLGDAVPSAWPCSQTESPPPSGWINFSTESLVSFRERPAAPPPRA